MIASFRGVFAALAVLALAAPVAAQEKAGRELAGLWKRTKAKAEGATPREARFVRLDWDEASGTLKGTILNPPAPDLRVVLALTVTDALVTGTATWHEPKPKTAPQPGEWTAETSWKLTQKDKNRLEGQCEWLDWEGGKVFERGFDDHVFERVRRTPPIGGPSVDKVEAGLPIDAKALAGLWRDPMGKVGTFKQDGDGFVVARADGTVPEPRMAFAVKDGLLAGKVAWAPGVETAIELKLANAETLEGRCEWVEAEAAPGQTPARGWSAIKMARLAALDAPPAGLDATKTPVPYADKPEPLSNLRRSDGLYVVLVKDGDGYKGELRTKDGEVKAQVELKPEGKLWVGTATFKSGTSAQALRWELGAPDEKGVHAACLETGAWDGTGAATTSKVNGWTFAKLRRLE